MSLQSVLTAGALARIRSNSAGSQDCSGRLQLLTNSDVRNMCSYFRVDAKVQMAQYAASHVVHNSARRMYHGPRRMA